MKLTFMEGAVLAWFNPTALLHILQSESLGMESSINPLNNPWEFGSATVAKHRLRAVTKADRKACGDGKWVCRYKAPFMLFDLILQAYWRDEQVFYKGKPVSTEVALHALKPRYRWERRR